MNGSLVTLYYEEGHTSRSMRGKGVTEEGGLNVGGSWRTENRRAGRVGRIKEA